MRYDPAHPKNVLFFLDELLVNHGFEAIYLKGLFADE